MASEVCRHIPIGRRRELIDQAGGKCANPGCSVTVMEIHHIREWHVYKSHEPDHMIALCPTCHGQAHGGHLRISDETLYEWKKIARNRRAKTTQLWVDPADDVRVIAGAVAFATAGNTLSLFDTGDGALLGFRVLGGDVLQVTLRLNDASGNRIMTVDDNVVRFRGDENVTFEHRPGKVLVTAPVRDDYLPQWLRDQVHVKEPNFFRDRYVAADIEVVRPGVVRVQGCFAGEGGWVVVTDRKLMMCAHGAPWPLVMVGDAEPAVFKWVGPANQSLFTFVKTMTA